MWFFLNWIYKHVPFLNNLINQKKEHKNSLLSAI